MADEPTLERGEHGPWVAYLRDLLVYVTGNDSLQEADVLDEYDDDMVSAVRRYQDGVGIDATGIVDDQTWESLRSEQPRGGSGDEEDQPADPTGETGGGAESEGDGGLMDLLGFTVVDLDFAGDPSVTRTTLEWNVENKGNSPANSYVVAYEVSRDGDTLFSYQDTRTPQGGIAAGGVAPDGVSVEDFNWHLETDMITVNGFDVFTIDVTLEPGEEWEKQARLDFRVNVADAAPKEPASDEEDDDDSGDQEDLTKVESFKTA